MARVKLFPLCDHTNILTSALFDDEAQVATRPDALIFAWLVAIPKGVYAQRAARAIIAVANNSGCQFSNNQRALLRELADIAAGTPKSSSNDTHLEASWRRITSGRRQPVIPTKTPS